MDISNIYLKFYYLPYFVPLIQLLVGSVFIAAFFVKPKGSFSEMLTNKLNEILIPALTGDNLEYELLGTTGMSTIDNTLNADYSIIRRSVMFIMALYGAMILFYCALFREQTIFRPQYIPSPIGVLLMTIIVFVYLCCTLHGFGKKHSTYNGLKVVSLLMIVVFFLFIIVWPDITIFSNENTVILHVVTNVGLLFNMCFCLLIFIKKKILPSILIRKAYNIKFHLNIVSRNGIGSRLEYIMSQRGKNEVGYIDIMVNLFRILLQTPPKQKTTPVKNIMTERAEVFERNRDVKRFIDIGIIIKKS